MSSKQAVQHRSAANVGEIGQGRGGSRDRLVYLTKCLIECYVEVQVLDGSIFSGIFHATEAERNFEIILKNVRLNKDCAGGQESTSDSVMMSPSNIMTIPGEELVQIIAKDVPLIRSGLASELLYDKQSDILIDSLISKSRHVDVERELKPWVPDDDDPGCLELENVFDGCGIRDWDQFEANEALFGVKSTFVEELYTTKLEECPQMKELEKEATQVAREIEREAPHELYLAEENLEIDEETKFSAVFRGIHDSKHDEKPIMVKAENDETFQQSYSPTVGRSIDELTSWTPIDTTQTSTRLDKDSREQMDVPLIRSGLASELRYDKQPDILIDSLISKSRRVDVERELKPWVCDDDDPGCPELENVFDGCWNRDHFEANVSLFGVKSTFVEELYTTKLEKDPQMKELEKEATQVATEIEGEAPYDLYLEEENLEIDEENKFSAVFRGVHDSKHDGKAILVKAENDETFQHSNSPAVGRSMADDDDPGCHELENIFHGRWNRGWDQFEANEALFGVKSTFVEELYTTKLEECPEMKELEKEATQVAREIEGEAPHELYLAELSEKTRLPKPDVLLTKGESSGEVRLTAEATADAPSGASSEDGEATSCCDDEAEGIRSSMAQEAAQSASPRLRLSSSTSSTSEHGSGLPACYGRGLSPSSSVSSMYSERSMLNPNASRFESSHTPLRPASPVLDGSFYYQANVGPVPYMPGLPVGTGVAPLFAAPAPVIYNQPFGQQPMPYFHPFGQQPMPYFHPNGPQYVQQMTTGQRQPLYYMLIYPPKFMVCVKRSKVNILYQFRITSFLINPLIISNL